jgi:hypothetical protein
MLMILLAPIAATLSEDAVRSNKEEEGIQQRGDLKKSYNE